MFLSAKVHVRTSLLLLCLIGLATEGRLTAAEDSVHIDAVQVFGKVPPRPGRWWHFGVTVANPTSRAEEVRIVARLASTEVEFAAETNLAAGSSRRIAVPILFPQELAASATVSIAFDARIVRDGKEILIKGGSDRVVRNIQVRLSDQWSVTALLAEPPSEQPPMWSLKHAAHDEVFEFAKAIRAVENLPPSVILFDSEPLPTSRTQWDGIDNLIIADGTLLAAPEAVATLRRWLLEGGHAMVMLDKVDARDVAPLLGDSWLGEVVDRVHLPAFQMKTMRLPNSKDADPVRLSDGPLPLVRLVSQGGEVIHRIDGWPAAIELGVGLGTVWLVAAGTDAWMHSDTYDARGAKTDFRLYPWTRPMTASFLEPTSASGANVSAASAAAFIDYPVPSRAIVAGCLFGFLILVIGARYACRRTAHLERFAWAVPGAAILVSAPLLWSTWARGPGIPDTFASIQLAELQPRLGQAAIEQHGLVYLTQSKPIQLTIDDGLAVPDAEALQASYRVTETGRSRRLNVPDWPRGMRPLTVHSQVPTNAVAATGRFGRNGVLLEFPDSLPSRVSDPALLDRSGQLHSLVATGDTVFLLPGEHLAESQLAFETLVDSRARRRRDFLSRLSGSPLTQQLADQEYVFAWTALWPQPASLEESFRVTGEALNFIPVRYFAPNPGSTIVLPATVVSLEPAGQTLRQSSIFQLLTGRTTVSMIGPVKARLRWQLPSAVLPLRIESAYCTARATAPGRVVSLSGVQGEARHEWFVADSPDGDIGGELTADSIWLDPQTGSIEFELTVSDVEASGNAGQRSANAAPPDVTWVVSELQFEVQGEYMGASTEPLSKGDEVLQ